MAGKKPDGYSSPGPQNPAIGGTPSEISGGGYQQITPELQQYINGGSYTAPLTSPGAYPTIELPKDPKMSIMNRLTALGQRGHLSAKRPFLVAGIIGNPNIADYTVEQIASGLAEAVDWSDYRNALAGQPGLIFNLRQLVLERFPVDGNFSQYDDPAVRAQAQRMYYLKTEMLNFLDRIQAMGPNDQSLVISMLTGHPLAVPVEQRVRAANLVSDVVEPIGEISPEGVSVTEDKPTAYAAFKLLFPDIATSIDILLQPDEQQTLAAQLGSIRREQESLGGITATKGLMDPAAFFQGAAEAVHAISIPFEAAGGIIGAGTEAVFPGNTGTDLRNFVGGAIRGGMGAVAKVGDIVIKPALEMGGLKKGTEEYDNAYMTAQFVWQMLVFHGAAKVGKAVQTVRTVPDIYAQAELGLTGAKYDYVSKPITRLIYDIKGKEPIEWLETRPGKRFLSELQTIKDQGGDVAATLAERYGTTKMPSSLAKAIEAATPDELAYVIAREMDVGGTTAARPYTTEIAQIKARLRESHPYDALAEAQRAAPEGLKVETRGQRYNRSGDVVGDVNPNDVTWVKTEDVYNNARKLPREDSTVPGSSLDDYAAQIRDTGEFPKPIEIVDHGNGIFEVTDGNHTLEAAHRAGVDYVPVLTLQPLDPAIPLHLRAARIDPVAPRPIGDVAPSLFESYRTGVEAAPEFPALTPEAIEAIRQGTLSDGGVTWNPRTGEFTRTGEAPPDTYGVATNQEWINAERPRNTVLDGELDNATLVNEINRVRTQYREEFNRDAHVGTWNNTDGAELHVDPMRVVGRNEPSIIYRETLPIAEDGFLYHITSRSALDSIRREGLRPRDPMTGKAPVEGAGGQTAFGSNPRVAFEHNISGKAEPVILRVRADAVRGKVEGQLPRAEGTEILTVEAVDASAIEVLTDAGWETLTRDPKQAAFEIAARTGQKAIYDYATGETIPVPKEMLEAAKAGKATPMPAEIRTLLDARIRSLQAQAAQARARTPVYRFPKASTIRGALRAPVNPLERFLSALFDVTKAKGFLEKFIDDLPTYPKLYSPQDAQRPINWLDHNVEVTSRWLRRLKVDEPTIKSIIQKLMDDVKTGSDFYDWMGEVRGAIDTALPKGTPAELRATLTRTWDRPVEGRTRSVVSDPTITSPYGGRPGVTYDFVLRDAKGQPLPSMPSEFAQSITLPSIEHAIDATSSLRRVVRAARKVGYGKANLGLLYDIPNMFLRAGTRILKGPVLVARLPALVARIQLEQFVRAWLHEGRVVFNVPGKGLSINVGPLGTLIPDSLIPEIARAFPDGKIPLIHGRDGIPLPENPGDLGMMMTSMLDMEGTPRIFIEETGIYNTGAQAPPGRVFTGWSDTLGQLRSDRLVVEFARNGMDVNKVRASLERTEWGKAYLAEQEPILARSQFSGLPREQQITGWLELKKRQILEVTRGDPEVMQFLRTGKLRRGRTLGTKEINTSTGHAWLDEWADMRDRVGQIEGELRNLDRSVPAENSHIRALDVERRTLIRQIKAAERDMRARGIDYQSYLKGRERLTDTGRLRRTKGEKSATQSLAHNLRDKFENNLIDLPDHVAIQERVIGDALADPGVGETLARIGDSYERIVYSPMKALTRADLAATRGSVYFDRYRVVSSALERKGWGAADVRARAQLEAARYTSDLMYDLGAKSSIHRALKDLFWFAPAWQEIMYTWAVKIPSRYYWPVGAATLIGKGAAMMDLFRHLGVIQKNADGEDIVTINVPGFIEKMLGDANVKLPEEIYFRTSGLNLVTSGGIMPGLSSPAGFVLGKAALRYGGIFKTLSDAVMPFGVEQSFLPTPVVVAYEMIFGEPPPFELFAKDWQKAQWDRTWDAALQFAYADMVTNGIVPPKITDFKNDEQYQAAFERWWDTLFDEGQRQLNGMMLTKMIGSTVSPSSLSYTSKDLDEWRKFWTETIEPLFQGDQPAVPAVPASITEPAVKVYTEDEFPLQKAVNAWNKAVGADVLVIVDSKDQADYVVKYGGTPPVEIGDAGQTIRLAETRPEKGTIVIPKFDNENWSLLSHELGHALGLPHPEQMRGIMGGARERPGAREINDVRERFGFVEGTPEVPAVSGGFTQEQKDYVNEYLAVHPESLAFATFYTAPGEKVRDLPFTETEDDQIWDAYYTGERRYKTPEEMALTIAISESRRHLQAKLNKGLKGIGDTASEQLVNGFQRTEALTDYLYEWDRFVTMTPGARDILDRQADLFAEKYGIPKRSFEQQRLAETINTLNSLGEYFTNEVGMRTQEAKAQMAILKQLYSDKGEFGEPTDAAGKARGWYFENVMSPYLDKTAPLYERAQKLDAAGIYAGDIYDRIRGINNKLYADSLTHNGESFPSPEEVFFGNRSPIEQQQAVLGWATRPASWLSDFQREQVGIKGFEGINELTSRLNKSEDEFRARVKKADVSPNSKDYDRMEAAWQREQEQIASEYGKEGERFLRFENAAPYERLEATVLSKDYIVTEYGERAWNKWKAVTNAVADIAGRLKERELSPSGFSQDAVYYKVQLYGAIQTIASNVPEFKNLMTDLSYAMPQDSTDHRSGALLFNALFYNNFSTQYVPQELTEAAKGAI